MLGFGGRWQTIPLGRLVQAGLIVRLIFKL